MSLRNSIRELERIDPTLVPVAAVFSQVLRKEEQRTGRIKKRLSDLGVTNKAELDRLTNNLIAFRAIQTIRSRYEDSELHPPSSSCSQQ